MSAALPEPVRRGGGVRAWALAVGALAALAGCRPSAPPPPELGAIDPARLRTGAEAELVLTGRGFRARVRADLDRRADSEVFLPHAWLEPGDGAGAVALTVLRVEPEALTLLAPALDVGTYGLRVEDPWGRAVALAEALDVYACDADAECDDGQDCTLDACVEGACVHEAADGYCDVGDACVPAGRVGGGCLQCDPQVSRTALVAVANGTACDDGIHCTGDDRCQAGACAGAPVTCPVPAGACRESACDEATGACVEQVLADGATCDDGESCTAPDACAAGVCGGPPACANTPPRACLVVRPVGAVEGEPVTFDARCSDDLDDLAEVLEFRFDFDGDGTWDTAFAAEPVAEAFAGPAGVFRAAVEVRDAAGLGDIATRYWSSDDGAADVVVTTAGDEADPGATPAVPGGTGLSLREAIVFANATPAVRRIRFVPDLAPVQTALPALTRPQLVLAGEDAMTLDFTPASGSGNACLPLAGLGLRVVGVRMLRCPGAVVDISAAQVALWDVRVDGPANVGVDVRGADALLGPLLEVRGVTGVAINLRAASARVVEARVHHNQVGLRVNNPGGSVRVERSLFHHQVASALEVNNHGGLTLLACTVFGNGGDGVRPQSNAGGLSARGSLFVGNGGYGLAGPASGWSQRVPNGYFGNGSGAVQNGPLDVSDLTADPGFRGAAKGDLRLRPDSAAVDRGADLGLDHNGPGAGSFFGEAPDLGAWESPWGTP